MDLAQTLEIMNLILPQIGGKNKIRIVYDVNSFEKEMLLILTTDAISAFDFVMLNEIRGKGIVLNEISSWWFKKTARVCPNHFVTDDIDSPEFPEDLRQMLKPYKNALKGRIMLVRKTKPLQAEFIVRRYLLGSAWESYQNDGMVCSIKLPAGLKKGARLDEPIFTPSTKAGFGEHDVNITYPELETLIGKALAKQVKKYSLALFECAESVAAKKGLTLQDTKFEFGLLPNGTLILIDELFTPDNSRWTPDYTKQPFRDALIWVGANKSPVMLGVPIMTMTERNYASALKTITSRTLAI